MIKKIYLDLDGVLTSFEERYADLYGYHALKYKEEYPDCWPDFVAKKEFATLDWFPGGRDLISFLRKQVTGIPIEILSSTGGKEYHDEVARQKRIWLGTHGVLYKANLVPGRRHKASYAGEGVVLVDDTKDNIIDFDNAGGIGIHHTDAQATIETLRNLLSLGV